MEFVNNLHPSIKFKKGKTKQLLVDAYLQDLPEKIWNRTKQGFTFPFENWFKKMNVFKKSEVIPQWAYINFLKGKLNFARLWAIFLASPKEALSNIENLD